MSKESLNIFSGLAQYIDKLEILKSILAQLEKDTGLDYTKAPVDADNPFFLETLRNYLATHLRKVAGQNQTRFMHLIYRVDITQSKLSKLEMDEHYFSNLADLVLNRMFQKTITKRYFKP